MSKKQITVLMAAVLAIATIVTAGLAVLPGSVEEAQANPCSSNIEQSQDDNEQEDNDVNVLDGPEDDDERECVFIGNLEDAFDED
jgi:hypothetical protein